MNRLATLSILLCGLILVVFIPQVGARDQDLRTIEQLIEKFERVYLQMAPEDETRLSVTLRLADLLAEKGRLLSNQELATNCSQCTAGEKERKEALKYYSEVVEKISLDRRGAVYAQMGHLYELTGEPNKAMKLYEHILDSEKTPDILAEAQISLAELMFRRRQYQNALIHYREALKFPEFRRRAYASYRVAWSQFNLGELDSAIAELVQLLKIPQQLNERNSVLAGNQSVDVQFMEEVSRDLSTFIARRGLKMEDVESIYNLSPERIRLDNLNFLANELERLGQPIIAAKVWKFSEAKQSDPHKRLEAHIHLAELELHQGNKKGSLAELEKSLRLWGQSEVCKQALCKEFKNAIKNYIVNWNREEKSNPSDELSEAYDQYFAQFSDDLDMLVWAGMAEEKRKNWAKSLKQYSKALALYANAQADEKAGLPSYESLLLTQVEIGEKSENEDLSLLAIDNYLNLSKEKTKWLEVSYQRAYKLYKKGQYEKASTQMRELALDRSVEYFGNAAHLKAPSDESGVQEMKLQAANLALDAAAILKKDHEVEMWSEEFARAFPRKKEEFQDIARRSILNQAVLEAGDLNDLDKVSSAWSILERFRIEEAKDAELITFYKTRMLYSEKLRKLDELGQSIEALLNIKKIKAEDYQLALNRKAWLAELKLDFKTALTLTQNLRSTISPEEKSLQLAIYADLAGLESESYYQKYLNATNDPEKRLAAAARVVRRSTHPQKSLDELSSILLKNPDLYAQLQYEIYLKNGDRRSALKRLSKGEVAKTAPARNLWREDFLSRLKSQKEKIANHQLKSSNDHLLARTLKVRLQMIEKIESLLNEAVSREDWMAQMLSVHLLGKESGRFYDEILSLAMPEGLDQNQQKQYLELLSQQAAPHQTKAIELRDKFQQFWEHQGVIEALKAELPRSSGPEREKYMIELKMVEEVAPSPFKESLQQIVSSSPEEKKLPSLAELERARTAVRQNPFDPAPLEQLLNVEKMMGQVEMINYLEKRLTQLTDPSLAGQKKE